MSTYRLILRADEVRALLERGSASVVRPVEPQPPRHCNTPMFDRGEGWFYYDLDLSGDCEDQFPDDDAPLVCPLGLPGEVLWCAEPWAEVYDNGEGRVTVLRPTSKATQEALRRALYQATARVPANAALVWRDADSMPAWASRLSVRIVSVTVEQRGGVWCWVVQCAREAG